MWYYKKKIPLVSAIQKKKVKLIIKNKTNELEAPYLEIEEPKKITLTSREQNSFIKTIITKLL